MQSEGLAYLLLYDHRWFWATGLATIAILAALILRARRHAIRRARHLGPRQALVLPVALGMALVVSAAAALATAVAGERIYRGLAGAVSTAGPSAAAQNARFWAGIGLGVGWAGLTASTVAWLWIDRRGRRQWLAETCPRCGAADSWKYLTREQAREMGAGQDESESDDLRQRDDEFLLVCENTLPSVGATACGWSLLERWEQTPRLNLSVLGPSDSGKTQWLAMTWYQLRQRLFPANVRCAPETIPPASQLARAAEDIVAGHGAPATAGEGLPWPVVFPFHDRDRFGSSDVLLHVFDYPGEIASHAGHDDDHLQQALAADGVLLFIDPTAPDSRRQETFSQLAAALSKWAIRPDGSRSPVPVAVCFSKLDRLVDCVGPSGGYADSIDEFYRQLQQTDPDGTHFSPRTVDARDRLCRKLRQSLWPEWDVEALAGECFGRAWRWFPLSGLGLDDLGSTDPGDVTLAPFGVLEPLLWLVHVNGYPVLR